MSYKKKVIIVNNDLASGGVQKALLNLLYNIEEKYEVTLFIFNNSGDFKNSLPKGIKVIEGNSFLRLLGISQSQSKKEGWFLYILRAALVIWTRLFKNTIPFQFLISTHRKLSGYDVAISYLHSSNDKEFYGGCNEFVLKKVEANKKIAFLHCDYSQFGGNTEKNKGIYSKFDNIATVSEGCKETFIREIPSLSSKTLCVRNCNNYSEIHQKANESPFRFNDKFFNIVTVARLSNEKGIVRTISVIAELARENYKIKWYIIGEGRQRKEIEELIKYYSLDEEIILYGNQKNPYKYMVNADLFLLPSYHEAAPMVFDEAKCLGLPILATKTTSTYEMIIKDDAGWVCENSPEGIKSQLEYIFKNLGELEDIRKNLKRKNFNNRHSLKSFHRMIEGATINV